MNPTIMVEGDGFLPTKPEPYSAGWDLYADEDVTIPPLERRLIGTGIKISCSFSQPFYWRIAPRSGLALKNGIDVLAGVVDSSYRGNIGIILFNTSTEEYRVKRGDRIAQIIPELVAFYQADTVRGSVDTTERGSGGFGSSGK